MERQNNLSQILNRFKPIQKQQPVKQKVQPSMAARLLSIDPPLEFIRILDESIPNKCPSLNATDREIWAYAGQRALIDKIIKIYMEK